MLRSLLERFSRNRVLRRRLPLRAGGDVLFVTPDAGLRHWKRDLQSASPELFDFAEEFVKPGQVVWDIGANMGLFTFASAYHAGAEGMVLALEPDAFCVQLLRRSVAVRSAGRARVAVIPAAVGAALGVEEFLIAERGISSSHLASVDGNSQSGGVRETVQVITVTLDWLLERFPPPAVLKIDVEGAEVGLLQGGARLLGSVKPILFCEVSDENADACGEIFTAHGYSMYHLEHRPRRRLDRPVFNTLCIHERQPSGPA